MGTVIIEIRAAEGGTVDFRYFVQGKEDVMPNPAGRPRKCLPDAQIQTMYLQGISESEISRDLGVSRPTVHRRLISMGVPLRDAVQATSLRNHQTFTMTPELLEVVDGLLLGDAWLEATPKGEGRLCIEQAAKHSGWLDMVEGLFTNTRVRCTRSTRKPRLGEIHGKVVKGNGSVMLRTRKYQPFTEQRLRWYPADVKRVPKDVRLGPIALAHWYWGDGATSNKGYRMVFHTDGFEEEDVVLLQDRLRDLYGWTPTMTRRSGREGFILSLYRAEQRAEMVELIAPFCPPCFKYKLKIKRKARCRIDEVEDEFRHLRE